MLIHALIYGQDGAQSVNRHVLKMESSIGTALFALRMNMLRFLPREYIAGGIGKKRSSQLVELREQKPDIAMTAAKPKAEA